MHRGPRWAAVCSSLTACLVACAAPEPARTASAGGGAVEPRADAAAGPAEDDASVPVSPGDPVWGARNAPVTIVEFADFQCPFCERVEPTLAQLREAYGPDKLRIVWKNDPLPFHPNARGAAEAAVGVFALAGSDAFWRFHDAAFGHRGELSEDSYVAWATASGVSDATVFRSGLRSRTWSAKVDADLALAKTAGAVGTPWFFVNGIRLEGAQPVDVFRKLVDAQLAAAQAKIAGGTPPARVYAVLSKENAAAQPAESDEDQEDDKQTYRIPLGKSPVRGNAAAPITIVEFADYQCPYCVRAEVTMRELQKRYGDQLRFVFKDQPLAFHPRAEPAAQAALEVRSEKGDGAFWAMHDALFDHHDDLGDDALVRLAQGAGARPDAVRAAIAGHTHADSINADEDVADDFEVEGTPQFFVNGRHLAGAQPIEKFVAVIDQELPKAKDLVAHGTRPDAVYEALTKDGRGPAEPERAPLKALPPGDPSRGPAGARVTIHEFADFQCPFCVRAEATVRQIQKAYAGKVRFVWHDYPLPFHENALPAARAAREAMAQRGPAMFWELHDRFLTTGKITRPELDEQARALGLDMTRWAAALDGDAHGPEVEADRTAAQELDVNGTPSFLVVPAGANSGYRVVGAQSYGKFRKVVDRALAEAK
jgi:protein-disulfide isomerase